MVLASGEIVHANANENADLFWAIRGTSIFSQSHCTYILTYLTAGGGCNFGVITEFTYQGHPHPDPVYSGMLVFKPDQLETLVETVNTWYETEGQNPKTCLFLVIGSPPPEFTPALAAVIFYDGVESEGRRVFKPFFDLNPVADLTNTHPYVQQVCSSIIRRRAADGFLFFENAMLNQMLTEGYRRYFKATALRNLTIPILQAMFDAFVEFTTHVGTHSAESTCFVEFVPRGKINSLPNDSAAYNNRGDWLNITLIPTWGTRTEYDSYAKEWVDKLIDKFAALEKFDKRIPAGKEVIGKRGYFNASMGDEDVSVVFGEHYPRLRELKRKYDSEFVFRKWFPIVPAVE